MVVSNAASISSSNWSAAGGYDRQIAVGLGQVIDMFRLATRLPTSGLLGIFTRFPIPGRSPPFDLLHHDWFCG
jgi:hypothetical protein